MLRAQTESFGIRFGTLSLMCTSPQGEYQERTGHWGIGGALDLGGPIPGMPLAVGLSIGWAVSGMGGDSLFSYDGSAAGASYDTFNSQTLLHLFFRFQQQDGAFRPYFEGLVGATFLYSSASLDEESPYGEQTDSHLGPSFSFGAGGGIAILVYSSSRGSRRSNRSEALSGSDDEGDFAWLPHLKRMFVDARVRYLYGTPAVTYPGGKAEMNIDGMINLVESNRVSSHTSMLIFTVGVTAYW
jgi:hypothetical protein